MYFRMFENVMILAEPRPEFTLFFLVYNKRFIITVPFACLRPPSPSAHLNSKSFPRASHPSMYIITNIVYSPPNICDSYPSFILYLSMCLRKKKWWCDDRYHRVIFEYISMVKLLLVFWTTFSLLVMCSKLKTCLYYSESAINKGSLPSWSIRQR